MLPEPLDERRGGIKKQGLVHDDRFGCSQLGKRNATSLPWISKSLSKRSGKVSERNSESEARFGSLEKKRKKVPFFVQSGALPAFLKDCPVWPLSICLIKPVGPKTKPGCKSFSFVKRTDDLCGFLIGKVFQMKISAISVALLLHICLVPVCDAGVIANWVNWTHPGSFTSTANTAPVSGWWGTDYVYAPSLNGSLAMPDGSTVGVVLTGEAIGEGGAEFLGGGPFFGKNGSSQAAFLSDNVPTLHPTGSGVTLAGWGAATQTLTFSKPVNNITMAIQTLGSPSTPATWTFSQSVEILSDGSKSGDAPFQLSTNGLQLTGNEALGVIQFTGSFTQFSWTVSAPEMFAVWTVGATSAPLSSAAVPEPSICGLGIAGLTYGGFVKWRRRRKSA
jgi:hypothetical protein